MNVGEDEMSDNLGLQIIALLYYFEYVGGPNEKIFCSL